MNLSKKRCTQAGFHVSSGVLALVLVFCVGIVFNPGLFLSHSNMQNILRQTVTNALLAYGMAFVIISGSIDLSVAATVAMSGYITVWLLPYSFALALAAAVLFGVAVGTINGYLIAKVKFPPMIATYSMQLMIPWWWPPPWPIPRCRSSPRARSWSRPFWYPISWST